MKVSVALTLLALSLALANPVAETSMTEVVQRDDSEAPLDYCGGAVKCKGPPDYCGGAVNCQTVFHNRTGTWGVAFKDNMGPGSAWFAKNVEPYDKFSDKYDAGEDSLEKRAGDITSNLDRSMVKIRFGDGRPWYVLNNGLNNHCYQTSCDADWTFAVKWSDGSTVDGGAPAGLLKFDAIGTYPGNKEYYSEAIANIARQLHVNYVQNYEDCVPNNGGAPTCTTKSIVQNKSGKYFSITRFLHTNGSKAINGYVHVKVTFKTLENPDVCQDIINGLTTIMSAGGTVASIGGGFFGLLGDALCEGN